nr:MAG TPA: hypothetical protein [Caudoviricetes sp.]
MFDIIILFFLSGVYPSMKNTVKIYIDRIYTKCMYVC